VKTGLVIVAALFIGAFGAHFLMDDPGYMLLTFLGYSFETTVPGVVLLLILSYISIRIVLRLLRAPRNIGRAAGSYRRKRARGALTKGLSELSAGHWARSERMLARAAHRSDSPVLHYLGAARAAQGQGNPQRRDTWLKLAYEQDPNAAPAVLLTQAELQLADHETEEALATLQRLDDVDPGHAQCLAMKARIFEELCDWDELRALMPRLRRVRALPADKIDELDRRVQLETLARAGAARNPEQVHAYWRGLPKRLKTDPELLRAYVNALKETGDHQAAVRTIRKALKSHWDEELAVTYGELALDDPIRELKRIEEWLKDRREDPSLLLAAARVSMAAELWGKARTYLELSLERRPSVEGYQLYGQLLDQLGETDKAAGAFRSGLALATGRGAGDLPALSPPDALVEHQPSAS